MIPGEVLALIKASPELVLPGIPTDGLECQGSKFHSPRPMVVHPYPVPDAPREMIYLCGTCSDNVRLLLSLQSEGEIPWTARRCFGNLIRAVAASDKEKNHA